MAPGKDHKDSTGKEGGRGRGEREGGRQLCCVYNKQCTEFVLQSCAYSLHACFYDIITHEGLLVGTVRISSVQSMNTVFVALTLLWLQ